MLSQQLVRRFATSALRRSGHEEVGAKPGRNLPFKLGNRYKLTAYFMLFFGSGFATPFLIVRHQMLK